jgi:hypothetical protein
MAIALPLIAHAAHENFHTFPWKSTAGSVTTPEVVFMEGNFLVQSEQTPKSSATKPSA